MWKSPLPVVHRVVVPLLLVAAGIAAMVMGQRHHAETVYAEQKEETTKRIRVAAPQMFPPGFPPQPFDGMGGMPLDDESQFRSVTVIETVRTTSEVPEPTLVREITFGGLERREGQLWRTYTGKPPALCPT